MVHIFIHFRIETVIHVRSCDLFRVFICWLSTPQSFVPGCSSRTGFLETQVSAGKSCTDGDPFQLVQQFLLHLGSDALAEFVQALLQLLFVIDSSVGCTGTESGSIGIIPHSGASVARSTVIGSFPFGYSAKLGFLLPVCFISGDLRQVQTAKAPWSGFRQICFFRACALRQIGSVKLFQLDRTEGKADRRFLIFLLFIRRCLPGGKVL